MRITELILYKYARFGLSNIQELLYTPVEITQIILGSNSCGKSSLLSQLTPSPPDKNEFDSEGYKTINIEHAKSRYELYFVNDSPPRYSFLKDGIELNQPGKRNTQIELVRQEFGVTKDIRNLQLGYSRFTSMSLAERRKWVMMVSPVDFGYVLDIHTQVKEAHRDSTGSIKLLQSRLTQEKLRQSTPETLQGLADDVISLQHHIGHYLELKTSDTHVRELQGNTRTISQVTEKISELYYKGYISPRYTKESLTDRLVDIQTELRVTEQHTRACNTSIAEYRDQLNTIQGKVDSYELKSRIFNLKEMISDLEETLEVEIDPNEQSVIDAYQAVVDTLMTEVSALEEYVGLPVSSKDIREWVERKSEYDRKQEQLKVLAGKHAAEVRRWEEIKHKQITCGKCGNVVNTRYDENKHILYQTKLDTVELEIIEYASKLEEATGIVDNVVLREHHMNNILQAFNTSKYLSKLLIYITDKMSFRDDPQECFGVLDRYTRSLNDRRTIIKLQGQLREALTLEDISQVYRSDQVTELTTKLNEQERILSDTLLVRQDTLRDKLSCVQRDIRTIDKVVELGKELDRLMDVRKRITVNNLTVMKNQTINEIVTALKTTLSQVQKEQHDLVKRNELLKDIEHQIEVTTSRRDALSTLLDALSPTDGIIAKNILGSIELLLGKVNGYIQSVWSFDMEVLPYHLDGAGDELTYKFPVSSGGVMSDDISKTSTSMQEIINLAFRLAILDILELSDILYLDEFGASMDVQHRKVAYEMIANLTRTGEFNQVFIISHFLENYGIITNADVSVLHGDNIETGNLDITKQVMRIL